MKLFKGYVSFILLNWFIAVSISMIVGILFLDKFTVHRLPIVVYNIWVITVLGLPVGLICSIYPRKIKGSVAATIILLVLSHTLPEISFPTPKSIIFIGSEGEDKIVDEGNLDSVDKDSSGAEDEMELPDEM